MLSSIPVPLDAFLIYNHPESSDPVGAARHDASGAAHQRAYRGRWAYAAGGRGGRAMRDLLGPHGFKYGTAARITRGKSVEMLIEVPFYLSLRLGDEPQAGAVAEQSGSRADEERARIPEWIEQAWTRGKLAEPHLAPRQMVRLRARRRQQHRTRALRAGDQRLAVVERLRGELSGMIDAHERSARAPVGLGKRLSGLGVRGGEGSGGP